MVDPGLPAWRLLLDRLHATFTAGSFGEAAAFAGRVAAATAADVEIDLRRPGVVRLSVPAAEVAAAETVAAMASEAGLDAAPHAAAVVEVAVDALDIAAVKPFWKAVLGYVDGGPDDIADPHRVGPPFWFQQMDAPRPQRNRLHVDVTVPHDVADERVAAALAAGGTLVTDRDARSFWVLADPEGNEACICTWQDRA
jgi:4a-hydroxytetrahydrobiopterin dehydratase